jgi:Ser/Thr protein kinase RdoA (MazF antagonist)
VSESRRPVLAPTHRDVLSSAVVNALRKAYDIGDWLDWQRTPQGSTNISFFVTASSGRYVLRCSTARKSLDAMRFEVQLIGYLRKRGYPAPAIIPTRRGEGYAEHNGTFYLMTAFIQGSPYDPENMSHLLAAGRGLGLYHQLAKKFPGPPYFRPSPILDSLGPTGTWSLARVSPLASRFLNADEQKRLKSDFSYISSQFIGVQRELAEVYPHLNKLIIHGSFGRSALIFDGERLIGIVDYDRATHGICGMDLAYTVKAFCRIHDQHSEDYRIGFDYRRCRELVLAYREVEPLAREEIQALPLVFREQRLLKVLNKCNNLLTKDAIVPQEAKDVRKLATMAEREAIRLRWLEAHSEDLRAALLD